MTEAFELNIAEQIDHVDPKKFGITSLPGIKPTDFFITSGDAVRKTEYMLKKLKERAAIAKSEHSSNKPFLAATQKAVKQCQSFLKYLLKIRGSAIFLEVEWRDSKVVAIAKNPRNLEALD